LANTSRSLRFTTFPQLAILCTLLVTSCISVANPDLRTQANEDAKGLFLESMEWGRIVDVYDIDGNLVEEDVLIDHLITTAPSLVKLIANAVTQKESLFIQFPEASSEFEALLFDYKDNLKTVVRRDIIGELTYDLVARNAAVRLNFNLPIDPVSVNSASVQVFQGLSSDSMLQFSSRFVVKNDSSTNPDHRGGILIDPTVSQAEAAEEQLPANVIGFGASSDANDYNMVVYIPTQIDLGNGVYQVLSTLDGFYGPGTKPNFDDDPNFDDEPVQIIGVNNYKLLAAMRTGNDLDEYRGFMRDAIRPSLLGIRATTISSHELIGSEIKVSYSVDAVRCATLTPKIGDVFEVVDSNNKNNVWTVVSVENSDSPDYTVYCVDSDYDNTLFAITDLPGKLSTRYSDADSDIQACYLDIVPDPVGNLPVGGILDNASVLVHFDESIDAATMRSLSTFVIVQPDDNLNPDPLDIKESQTAWYQQLDDFESVADFINRQRGYDYRSDIAGAATAESEYGGRVLFGQVIASKSNRTFSITPVAGWQDLDPTDAFDEYVVALRDGVDGIKDMSGNQVQFSSFVAGNDNQLIQLSVQHLDAANTKYFALRCNSLDEDSDGNVEWAGQVNPISGQLTGTVPSRFTRSADNSQFALSAHPVGSVATGTAPSEPLNFAGAVVMSAYRPEDFGFGYENSYEFNYTVEGLSWSPLNGVVYDENYDKISLALSHSFSMPDEMWAAPPSTTIHPQSGLLTSSFNDNVLGFTADGTSGIDEKMVFNSSYFTRSINRYQRNGIEYMPWPGFVDKFVWRDTSFDQTYLGGVVGNGGGAPTDNYVNTLGLWDPLGRRYAPGAIPTVALPLQLRFRTYPQMDALSLNAFATSLMMAPGSNPPNLPMFRVYSAGGQNLSGDWQGVQPDTGTSGSVPTGGYINGLATAAAGDDLMYWAAADFSLEVSRMHSHWFAISGPLNFGTIDGVIVEPTADKQPLGTSLVIEYRGSQAVSANANPFENSTPLNDASVKLGDTGQGDNPFDHYGDFVGGTGSVSTPSAWTTVITDLENRSYRFIQIRVSFMAEPDLDLLPTLDALGIVWTN
jgi:hypothetical protein